MAKASSESTAILFCVTAFRCSAPCERIVERTPRGMLRHRLILHAGVIASLAPSRLID
jgi:hypothetical protein